jgi:anoctamin-10/anoctamin-7
VVAQLEDAGLWVKSFLSTAKDEIYVKVAGPTSRLLKEADRTEYSLALDEHVIERLFREGDESLGRDPLEIKRKTGLEAVFFKRNPWQDIYGRYNPDADPSLYQKYENGTCLSQVDRIRLVYSIIEFAMKDEEADEVDDIAWGAGLNLDQLQQLDCILAHFPIHDPVYQHRIATDYTKCCTCCSKDGSDSHKVNSDTGLRLTTARLDTLRVYMGEKVALYFAFLEHFTTWMLVPAVFGVGLTIDQAGQGAIVTYAGPAFAVGIVLWATFIMESWKQKQATYAQEWGMSEFESLETPRIQFTTSESVHWVESPIDASPMPYFSPATKMFRLSMGALTMVSLFMVVIIGVWCVFMFKFWAVSVSPQTLGVFGSPLAAVLNSVQIMVMGHVWTKIADTLNDWETHRTDTEYEDHLIVKTSLFQFINHYTALFYIAFIKGSIPIIPGINQVDQCIFGGKLGPQLCDKELAQQLAIIFLTQMFVGNMTEVVVPALKQKIAKHKDEKMAREAAMKEAEGEVLLDGETKEAYVKQEKGLAELGFEADEYGMLEGMDDYLEIVVQFGYITLFVVAFPAAPFLAWMSNWLESRVDMTKLLHNARRPEPRGASDIGTWQDILIIVGNVAVLTNGALILFTSHFAAAVSFQARIWMFIGTEHIIFFIKFLADVLLPDEPEHVSLQMQRQEFVREHLIELQPYKKDSTNMRALAGKMTDEMEFAHQVAPAVVLDEDDNLDPGC